MTDDRFARLKRILAEVIELPEAERGAHVEQACGDDQALRAEAQELLGLLGQDAAILATDADALGLTTPVADTPASRPSPTVPDRIGRYQVLRVLGEGGMGVVYEAEQENPQRKVALKVVRPGLAAEKLLRRFEHESQVLGHLQHPGIAQIFEAGTADTAFGPQPFFAMEYIRGDTLGDWVSRHGPSLEERLDLFAHACDAVQHAHQKGVVHRDLKPGNILVDASGQPKILDFGVARVTDSDLQLTTMQTDTGQLIGTLPYMSPEQVAADPSELDTRSDVYSLGVILYELLAEKLPYELSGRSIPEAARVIQEQDPTSLSSLSRVYRGDLETIVSKALEKEKARRYESAEQLASDVRRYLRDEPIAARPPSTIYQLRKFAKRNKVLVGGVAAVLLALSAGLIVSVNQYLRAEAKRAESEAVTDFLSDMLASVDPGQGGRDVTVREVLDEAAQTIGDDFAQQPLVEAKLRQTIGDVYLGMLESEAAEPQLRQALDLRTRILGPEDPETLRSRSQVAAWHHGEGRLEEALAQHREILEVRRRVLGEDHAHTVRSLNRIAAIFRELGQYDESTEVLLQALDIQRRTAGEDDPLALIIRYSLAMNYQRSGYVARADSVLRPTLEAQRRILGEDDPNTLRSMRVLSGLLRSQGLYEESEAISEETLSHWRRVYGEDNPSTVSLMTGISWTKRRMGKLDEAASILREAIELGGNQRTELEAIRSLGLVVADMGRIAEAESLLFSVIERLERTEGEHAEVDILYCEHNLGHIYSKAGRHADAENVYRRYWTKNRDRYGEDGVQTLHAQNDLASACQTRGKTEEAETLYSEVVDVGTRTLGEDHSETQRAMEALAELQETPPVSQ